MFTLVLNNGEEFKLTLWDGQSFELTLEDGQNFELKTDGLVSRERLEPLPCTLVLGTEIATGYLYVYGESSANVLELASEVITGCMVKWGKGTTVIELQTDSGTLYGRLYGTGSSAVELGSTLYGSGNMITADSSKWQYIYELDTTSPDILVDKRGTAHSELEFVTDASTLYGFIYGNGADYLELATSDDVAGAMTVADRSQYHYTYELLSKAALATVVSPLYVGHEIDATINGLGDITMAEYCWREVIE